MEWVYFLFCLTAFAARTHASATPGSAYVSAVTALVKLFSSDEEHTRDLTAEEELVRGLLFDVYNEKISCKVLKGILIADYDTVIDGFVERFAIPKDIESSLREGKYGDENYEIVIDFKFEKGKIGSFTYGRVVTIKHGDKIDMAYSVYFLEFKLSPKEIRHKKVKKFLGFTTGKKVWTETKERNLSVKEKDEMQTYFMDKAIKGFKKQYKVLLEAEALKQGVAHNEL